MRSECPPFTNCALVADNDRMYHRIGWISAPAPKIPTITPAAQIEYLSGDGWVIRDGGRVHASYSDEQIRISILWKARVRPPGAAGGGDPLTLDRIVEIFVSDFRSRGLRIATPVSPVSDEPWLDFVHATYVVPVNVPE